MFDHCPLIFLLLSISGCSTTPAALAQPAIQSTHATNSTVSLLVATRAGANAGLSLDQIQPRPTLATSRPATRPDSLPPVEAVRLFAKARIALLDNKRPEAINGLEQAVALDPDSFELRNELGNAYAMAGDPRSLDQWRRAAESQPNHLGLQIAMARELIGRADLAGAMRHLRLALLTTDYARGDPADGEADFLLARALQQQGYDRAALEMYDRLLSRLRSPSMSARLNPQIGVLLHHPDELALQIAALYEKNHAYDSAIGLLRAIAAREPDNFELQSHVVRDTASAGRRDPALHAAADLVLRFHCDSQSLGLLREVAGSDAAQTLQRLFHEHPDDRDLLYGLIDELQARRRQPDARKVAEEGGVRWPDDIRLIRRRTILLRSDSDLAGAAKLLIGSLAHRPDHELELGPVWDGLLRPSANGRLRFSDVEALHVPPAEEPARLLLLARSAQAIQREMAARDALQRAVDSRPIFAPAWREMLALIWSDKSKDPARKMADAKALSMAAEKTGDAALAAELRAQSFIDQQDAQSAAMEFTRAIKRGDRSVELILNFAADLHMLGDDAKAANLLWQVIGDHPLVRDSYMELYAMHEKKGEADEAARVLRYWLASDPDSIDARRLEAREEFRQRRFVEAERTLMELLRQHDADSEVLLAVKQFYSGLGQLRNCAAKFRMRLIAEPWNFTLAMTLAGIYQDQKQLPQAIDALDRARSAAAHDSELLYALAEMYSQLGQKNQSEQVLRQVLQLDPSDAGASNDLGYSLAERDTDLALAEDLVSKALRAEPGNPSFLDSMGWVLYKRGKFDAAQNCLSKAATPESNADPVVLDHLGDTLYRLGLTEQAAAQWKLASRRLAEVPAMARQDLQNLREQLLAKQRQMQTGQAVTVAPVAKGE
jgi:tetratricopeptide (TPR) repeat protein